MTRGGKREKAGRKSTWVSGCRFEDTKLVRVPAAIADKVLELAHKLDAGEIFESVTKPKTEVRSSTPIRKVSSKPSSKVQGIACPNCGSTQLARDGFKNGKQRYVCRNCGRKFLEHLAANVSDLVTESS